MGEDIMFVFVSHHNKTDWKEKRNDALLVIRLIWINIEQFY